MTSHAPQTESPDIYSEKLEAKSNTLLPSNVQSAAPLPPSLSPANNGGDVADGDRFQKVRSKAVADAPPATAPESSDSPVAETKEGGGIIGAITGMLFGKEHPSDDATPNKKGVEEEKLPDSPGTFDTTSSKQAESTAPEDDSGDSAHKKEGGGIMSTLAGLIGGYHTKETASSPSSDTATPSKQEGAEEKTLSGDAKEQLSTSRSKRSQKGATSQQKGVKDAGSRAGIESRKEGDATASPSKKDPAPSQQKMRKAANQKKGLSPDKPASTAVSTKKPEARQQMPVTQGSQTHGPADSSPKYANASRMPVLTVTPNDKESWLKYSHPENVYGDEAETTSRDETSYGVGGYEGTSTSSTPKKAVKLCSLHDLHGASEEPKGPRASMLAKHQLVGNTHTLSYKRALVDNAAHSNVPTVTVIPETFERDANAAPTKSQLRSQRRKAKKAAKQRGVLGKIADFFTGHHDDETKRTTSASASTDDKSAHEAGRDVAGVDSTTTTQAKVDEKEPGFLGAITHFIVGDDDDVEVDADDARFSR